MYTPEERIAELDADIQSLEAQLWPQGHEHGSLVDEHARSNGQEEHLLKQGVHYYVPDEHEHAHDHFHKVAERHRDNAEEASRGLRHRVAGWKNRLLSTLGLSSDRDKDTHHHHDEHCDHDHAHGQLLEEDHPDFPRMRRGFGIAAVGSLALAGAVGASETFTEGKYGFSLRSMLDFRPPVVAEVAHDAGIDASAHGLRWLATMPLIAAGVTAERLKEKREKISQALGRAVGGVLLAGSAATIGVTAASVYREPGQLNPLENWFSGSKLTPLVALVGNTAVANIFAKKTEGIEDVRVKRGVAHNVYDWLEAAGRMAGVLLHESIGLLVGGVAGGGIGKVGVETIKDPKGALDGDGHKHSRIVEWLAPKIEGIPDVVGRVGKAAAGAFTAESESGERRVRKGVAAVTALGTFAVGAYLTNKFGIPGVGTRSQAYDQLLPDALDTPSPDVEA